MKPTDKPMDKPIDKQVEKLIDKRIVLIAGFESFNAPLYRQAAAEASQRCPQLAVQVFSDRDLAARPEAVERALAGADACFASLLFDYDQVEWLRPRLESIPLRLVFESALELMALTRFGSFTMGDNAAMPKPIRAILAKFSGGREEDRLAGYLGFLKVGPKLLRFIPSRKVQDLRHWLILYSYWNAGGQPMWFPSSSTWPSTASACGWAPFRRRW